MEKFWNWMERHQTIGQIVSWTILFVRFPIRSGRFWKNFLKESFNYGKWVGMSGGDKELLRDETVYTAIWTREFEKAFEGKF